MVMGGVSELLADVDHRVINNRKGRSVHKTVDERRIRILINLLDPASELVGWLRPVVILHSDDEYGFDFLGAGAQAAEYSHEGDRTKGTKASYVGHRDLPSSEDVRRMEGPPRRTNTDCGTCYEMMIGVFRMD